MGASIHMHIETKKDGRWHHFSAPHMYRDGTFFDLVAGIYGRREPVVPVRGLPTDQTGGAVSDVTRFCYEQDKQSYRLHHETWLGAEDLVALQQQLNDLCRSDSSAFKSMSDCDLENHYFHTFINGNCVFQHQGWDDVRLVCWFDN